MIYSSEARWFFEGDPPDPVVEWFDPDRSNGPENRTDRYLVFPGCDTVGVKVRDATDRKHSAFEVKARLRSPQVTKLGPHVTARADEWVKWSSGIDRFPDWTAAILASESTWVTVDKRRWLHKYSLDDEVPRRIEGDERPDRGCGIDLVILTAGDEHWWTLGLESFGPAEAVRPLLLHVGRLAFGRRIPHVLGVVQSVSYATWAAALVAD